MANATVRRPGHTRRPISVQAHEFGAGPFARMCRLRQRAGDTISRVTGKTWLGHAPCKANHKHNRCWIATLRRHPKSIAARLG